MKEVYGPKEFDQIVQWVDEADDFYYSTGKNQVPDKKYQGWIEYIRSIDPKHRLVTKIRSVEVDSLGKVRHAKKMLSLQKCYKLSELRDWMTKVSRNDREQFWLSPKLDGIAGRYIVSQGKLYTRGDGEYGEDVSHRLPLIKFKNEDDNLQEWDGEILITHEDFATYFQPSDVNPNPLITRKDGSHFKNPRNAIAGLMNSEYDLGIGDVKPLTMISYFRFKVPVTIENVDDAIKKMVPRVAHYPTDGLVVRLADTEYGDTLGATSHHYKHSMALKNTNQKAETTLIGVEFNMARSYIGMVGILKPVEVGGVTISRVTLHNMDFVKEHDLRIGDRVVIERQGDVIPGITGVTMHASNSKPIECTECPSCGSKVLLDKQFYKCINENCPDRLINKVEAGIKQLGVVGISTSVITKLVNLGSVKNVIDMFHLRQSHLASIGILPNTKSYNNFVVELNRVIEEPKSAAQIFASLQIDGFGKSLFEKIFAEVDYRTLLDDVSKSSHANKDDLSIKLPNVGPTRSAQLYKGLRDNKVILENLLQNFKILKSDQPQEITNGKDPLTICFSGKFSKPKSALKDMAREIGMLPVDSVSKNLNYLVTADTGSSKTKKAQSYGIKILDESGFLKLI